MPDAPPERTPVRGTLARARLPLALIALLLPVLAFTLHDPPAGRLNWLLEVGPGLLGIAVLLGTFRRFPMTGLVYVLVFLHVLVLTYGGYYTYANTPLGDWARDAFGLARNHYDRVGHLALGFFPAIIIREVLLRRTPLVRGGWLIFIVVSIALAIGAFYELIEWWSTLILAPEKGVAFLGSQGDPWDAQWDMLLAIVGSAGSLVLLGRLHDRSLRRLLEGRA
jgi:putative membrane protein